MGGHINIIISVLTLISFTYIVDCGLTEDKLTSFLGSTHHDVEQGTKWAVLVAGSNGYENYRHQADICHAYQILKRGGLKDENIIVFMYDDIAHNEENPRQGIIINNPHGPDVYKGVPKDYTGEQVTTNNLLAAILGDRKALTGGSGKVVNSGPNDHIFIYYSDHGSPGVLTMPTGDDLYAKDFLNTLKKKYELRSYKSMVIYVEACEAGSMFDGHGTTPTEWNIYVTTASNPSESSWATYCPGSSQGPPPPKEYDTCLGDLYSVAWMEDCDTKNLESETLQQQYNLVKRRTLAGKDEGSHVMQYGDVILSRDPLSKYMGINPNHRHHHYSYNIRSMPPLPQFDQYEADLIFFKQKVKKAAEGSIERAIAEKRLNEVISHRKHVDWSIEAITKTVFGASNSTPYVFQMLKSARPAGQPLVDDWDCLKSLVDIYKTHCGPLKSYGMRYTRVFANMCNAGVHKDHMIQATSLVCGQKPYN